ncbi:MAG: ribonuclease PH [Proteobacteria bacterium]|nr:ribonuclease PH [Pseudomonadota bacterium]
MRARRNGRAAGELRPVTIERGVLDFAEGSALIGWGRTRVLVAASVLDEVPPWRTETGRGWVTAEYDMLPRATDMRRRRGRGAVDGRAAEIQRLIGRALRGVVNLGALGPRTIHLDADVIQADGGTRTAAVTGAFVALVDALRFMARAGRLTGPGLSGQLAAVSAGVVEDRVVLDLDQEEDARAQVDANLVLDDAGRLIEIQATAEGAPLTQEQLMAMLDLARQGARRLMDLQRRVLGGPTGDVS